MKNCDPSWKRTSRDVSSMTVLWHLYIPSPSCQKLGDVIILLIALQNRGLSRLKSAADEVDPILAVGNRNAPAPSQFQKKKYILRKLLVSR